MFSDLRFALRQLGKSPGFTTVTVLTLALAIGACTVVFSIIQQIVLQPPDFPGAERVVLFQETVAGEPASSNSTRISGSDFAEWPAELQSFEYVGAETSRKAIYTGGAEPLGLAVSLVTRDLPRVWGETPALGRWFTAEEYLPGHDDVVVLDYAFWQANFGGAADVIGRQMVLDGESCTVVGVASQKWSRMIGSTPVKRPLVFSAARFDRNYLHTGNRAWRVLIGAARLRPGVTIAQAQAEMNLVTQRLAHEYPDTNKDHGVRIVTCVEARAGNLRGVLLTLLAAVGSVLFIACANIANLLLARATVRQREISVRAALGASRARLVGQLLSESMVLALLGSLGGALLAFWGIEAARVFTAGVPGTLALQQVSIDGRVLAVALGLGIGTGLVFGLAPAWLASRVELNQALKQGGRSGTASGSSGRLRSVLIVFQVASTLVLVAGTGLFIQSFITLARVDPGFDLEHTTTMRLDLPTAKYATAAQRLAFTQTLLERLRAVPGVVSAAAATRAPFQGAHSMFDYAVEGRAPRSRVELPTALGYGVTPEFFATTGVALRRGRLFTEHDHDRAPRVLLINETLAREQFPGEDALGQRLRLGSGGPLVEIVGVVADFKEDALDVANIPQGYWPYAQGPGSLVVIVRSTGDPAAVHAALKAQLSSVDRDQPITQLRTMRDAVDATAWRPRLMIALLGPFSALALVIAAAGIYAVIAYSVSQRTTEIGIRMALGASARTVLIEVLGRGARLIGCGLVIGLGGAFVAGQLVQAQLFQTSSHDPRALLLAIAVLAGVGLFACWLPARRAMRIDPIEALRAE